MVLLSMYIVQLVSFLVSDKYPLTIIITGTMSLLAPLSANTNFSIVEEVCNKFRFLGRFMAKAIMDSRMVSSHVHD